MLNRLTNPALFFLLTIILLLGPWAITGAQEQPAEPAALTPGEMESLIRDLEDPAAREQLIQQLKMLAQAKQAAAPPSEVQSATAELLEAVSRQLDTFTENALQIAENVNELPRVLSWAREQATDPQAQQLWMEVLLNLALVLGLGYLAFYVIRLLLIRPYRAIAQRPPRSFLARSLLLLVTLLLDLLPIAAFALAAYLTLGLTDPRDQTRLVALAWINASIIVRVILALGRVVFAPAAPGLRVPAISDETAHYADIWIRRLTFTSVYGYFALQAALLLGLPVNAYEALLRLLGFIVTMLVIVLIVQNRTAVADYIRGGEEAPKKLGLRALRNRLARMWHLLAVVYVLVLFGIWALEIRGGFIFLLRATLLTLLILVLAHAIGGLLEAILKRGFRINEELKTRFPGLEARANRYVPIAQSGLKAVVFIIAVIAILQAWNLNTFRWLLSEPGMVLSSTVVSVIGIIIVSFVIWEVSNSLIESHLAEKDRFGRVRVRSGRTRTLLAVTRNALLVVLVVIATLLVLSELGVNITPLLAGAGVLGLAVGFGSQKMVQDIITGVFILFDDLVSVGDVVSVGDKAGLVEAVSIRNMRLRDLSGTVHTIPFSAISTISNLTKDFSFYVFDVGIAYREDADEVMDVLKKIGAELQEDPEFGPLILEPLEVLGVDQFADSAVIIKARLKTLPIKQWSVGREFNRRMKKRFDELGIEIPFPHTTLYFGEGKQGKAAPARVQLSPGVSAQPSPLKELEKGTMVSADEDRG